MENEVHRILGISESDEPKSSPPDKLGSNADDFWAFRRMITPVIIQAIFWIGVIACIIGGIAFIGVGADEDEGVLIAIGIALILVGPGFVRLYCEMAIVFFRINETLTDIKNEISKRSQSIVSDPNKVL